MRILSLTQGNVMKWWLLDEYNEKKNIYLSEKAKRHEENQLLEEALFIYRDKIASVNEYLKKRVNEYVGDSLLEEKSSLKKQDSIAMRKGKQVQFDSDSDEWWLNPIQHITITHIYDSV